MSRAPVVKPRELCRALERAEFVFVRQRGAHAQYKRAHLLVTVPMHPGDVPPYTVISILRQARLTREELLRLL